jgi:hypothetical protein
MQRRGYVVTFNGQKDQRLCVERDEDYVKRVRGLYERVRHPKPKGQREVTKTWDRWV